MTVMDQHQRHGTTAGVSVRGPEWLGSQTAIEQRPEQSESGEPGPQTARHSSPPIMSRLGPYQYQLIQAPRRKFAHMLLLSSLYCLLAPLPTCCSSERMMLCTDTQEFSSTPQAEGHGARGTTATIPVHEGRARTDGVDSALHRATTRESWNSMVGDAGGEGRRE